MEHNSTPLVHEGTIKTLGTREVLFIGTFPKEFTVHMLSSVGNSVLCSAAQFLAGS